MDSHMKSKSNEATGISRSGRVRKKSSKLTDFESPDEIDTRFKRRTDRPQKVVTPKAMSEDSDSFLDEDIVDVKDEPLEVEEWGEEPEEEEEGEEEDEEEEGVVGEEGGDGGLPEFSDPLHVDEDSTDVSRETSNYTQAQSLYFSEKQGKKSIVMKGGQVVVRRKKAQRKDKGKSRFTAYMLWAREVRPGIIQANPNMDFSAVNKRLGELWALVPTTQKYNWKRRAKRLAAKGNQKGGLISTGRPSRPPPPARANLINKGGVKPAPRPDPNPIPPPPAPATHGTGHHRHPGHKVTKSRGKRRQPRESPSAAAGKRLDECLLPHLAQTPFHKATEGLCKQLRTITAERRLKQLKPYPPSCPTQPSPPPCVPPILGKKCKVEQELGIYIVKERQWEAETMEDEAEPLQDTIEVEGMRGTNEAEGKVEQEQLQSERKSEQHSCYLEKESDDIPVNKSLTDMVIITTVTDISSTTNYQPSTHHNQHLMTALTDGSSSSSSQQPSNASKQLSQPPVAISNTSFMIDNIFCDLFADWFECPFCPLSLVQAVTSVVKKTLTQEKASLLYCISPSRLQMCLSNISSLQKMCVKNNKYYSLLVETRLYPVNVAVTEWLLRMRRMGRSPVQADVKQVICYLSKGYSTFGSVNNFLKLYGEQKLFQEEWVIPSQLAAIQWHRFFNQHVFVRSGMKPNELLTLKNGLQVFTSAEVLVSLGDPLRKVIITRGSSNLYCMTQRNNEVFRAILTFSAGGQFHPPAILQKGYDLPHWALTEESVDLMASPDGRLDPLVFLGWLHRFEQRLTDAGVARPVVLLVHGHAAHGSPAADSFCCAKGIILHSHHHSPINLMDPFIHLLSPLIHYFCHTQDQLTTLTGTKPLPDYLLPSILADAWTQLCQRKLASEAFQRAGLVPYDNSKCFDFDKCIQIGAFPPLILEPLQTYFPCGDVPQQAPFDPAPQIFSTCHLRTLDQIKKSQCTAKIVKGKVTHDTCTKPEDTEEITDNNSDQVCDPLYIGPDPHSDASMMESRKFVHVHKNHNTIVESSLDYSSQHSSEGELDELPLSCELEKQVKSSVTSWSTNHQSNTEPHFTVNPTYIKSSNVDSPNSQPHVKGNPSEFVCNSSTLASSRPDELQYQVKVERVTPDSLDNDLRMKEEMESHNDSEEDNLLSNSLGKELPRVETVFISVETGDP